MKKPEHRMPAILCSGFCFLSEYLSFQLLQDRIVEGNDPVENRIQVFGKSKYNE